MRRPGWLSHQAHGDLEVAARRLRRITLAQLVVLVVGAVAAVAVAVLLLNAIVDGQRLVDERQEEQSRLVEARQSLQFLALNAIATNDRGRAPDPRVFLDFLSTSVELRGISDDAESAGQTPAPAADCAGCEAAAERARVLGLLDRMDVLTRRLLRSGGRIDIDGEIARVGTELVEALNAWVVANRSAVAEIRGRTASRNRDLARLGIAVIAAVSLGGLLLWVLLDRVRARTMARIRDGEARARALAENSSDIVLIVDPEGRVAYASPSVHVRLETPPEEIVGRRLASIVHPDDVARLGALDGGGDRGAPGGAVEWRLPRADGEWMWVEALITDARSEPSVRGWVVNTRDIGDRKAAEGQLTQQAFEDVLTGLPNRALFADRLAQALAVSERTGAGVAVALVDLDDFKTVNDSLGHAAGDAVLRELGERIGSVVRAQDTASRLGGDEFAILISGVGNREARMLCDRVVDAVSRPLSVEENVLSMQCSVGVALGARAEGPDALLRNADMAMYAAKAQPGSAVELFRPEMLAQAHERLALKRDLAVACDRGELSLAYQPIFELDGERLVGFEALLRWDHAESGMIPPATFIPLAEETGLIHDIGRWVLGTAAAEAAAWGAELGFSGHVAVNVSGAQLDDAGLPDHVSDALGAGPLEPGRLVVEVTESALPANPDRAVEVLERLKDLGVRLAIDDFGTGYSSLSYLGSLPVDVVKMDKCFVDDLEDRGRESDLAATILRIGAGLGLSTVAEGVERADQADRLRRLGCELGQGFFFSRPLAPDAARALIRASAGSRGRGLPVPLRG